MLRSELSVPRARCAGAGREGYGFAMGSAR